MEYTSYYKLKKPESTDQILIDDLNDNFDALDSALYDGLANVGDVSDGVIYFTEADDTEDLVSGETAGTLMGKISAWLSALKAAAFCAVANNDTTTSSGYVADARIVKTHGGEIDTHTTQLGGLYFATNSSGKWGYKTSSSGSVTPFRNPTGTAVASQVLSGYTFSNASDDDLTGTMTNRGTVTATLDCGESYTIASGYHSGSGKVTANSLSSQTSATATAARILSGYTAWVSGSKITGTMTNRGTITTTIDPGESYTIPAGYHSGSGKVTANEADEVTASLVWTYLGTAGSSSSYGSYSSSLSAKSVSGYASFTADNFCLYGGTLTVQPYVGLSGGDWFTTAASVWTTLSYNSSTGYITVSGLNVQSGSGDTSCYAWIVTYVYCVYATTS